jgi:acetyl-CoA carboxylase carboxyl transferase subunit alpha
MSLNHLDFEQPIAELQAKINELKLVGKSSDINLSDEIEKLEQKVTEMTRSIFSNLTPWQVAQMARHPQRPYLLTEYIPLIFQEFDEFHGDRCFGDDTAMVCGTARLDGQAVMVIGHQKGRDTKEKVRRNFGMASPEGYRKAQRMFKMAEKFQLPIFTFIDTSGAYPGVGAEERGQSEAIARSLFMMADLKTPIICTITGEGCSGGALGIGVGDRLLMLQYSTYSVISPEGCASILWKSASKAPEAAAAMNMTADRLLDLGIADKVIAEPLGGAHRNVPEMAANIKKTITDEWKKLKRLSISELLALRYQRLCAIGKV